MPGNITPIFLPSRAPELLNPVENVWQYLRQNWLSNTVFENYDAIVDAACAAWQKLIAQPETITSLGMRDWAHVGQPIMTLGIIRLVVMMSVRYPLSLRNVEDLLAERGIDISHETVRFWWNRFGPMFAAEIRKKRVAHMRGYPQWRWHLDEVFVKVNGRVCYLRRAVDHEGEVLEAVVTARRDKAAALKLLKRIMKKYGALAASSPMGFGHIRRR